MNAALGAFLEGRAAAALEDVVWPNVGLHFDVAAYITEAVPPLVLVTSVRAILIHGRTVLVFDDPVTGPHVLPGGQRQQGESVTETLAREVTEETGSRISQTPRRLGVLHLRLLSAKPSPRYLYPYPDTLQMVYVAWVGDGGPPTSRDDFVVAPRFVSAREAAALALPVTERAFLDAALQGMP